MRILAINGSPKGKQSNTWRLTSSFIDGITAQEEDARGQAPTVDTLSVGALDIKPCEPTSSSGASHCTTSGCPAR